MISASRARPILERCDRPSSAPASTSGDQPGRLAQGPDEKHGLAGTRVGFIAPPYRGAYNASKHALEALTETMRHELYGTNIHISLIEPGPITSRFVEHALDMFRDKIDIAGSLHREPYQRRLTAMAAGGTQTFKLPPEAVAAKLVHALESRRPKAHYYVTIPTYLAVIGKRLLPRFLADRMVRGA